MNVFVLCTGRCGSTTFARACRHIDNYTAAHESRSHLVGPERFRYPDDHVEVDNRLSWLLGVLDETFGSDAFYVHLIRDREATARSYCKRLNGGNGGIMNAFDHGIRMWSSQMKKATVERHRSHDEKMKICRAYCNAVNSNIALFLKDKPRKMHIRLEEAKDGFATFWEEIEAEGDLSAALDEWDISHNAANLNSKRTAQVLAEKRLHQKLYHKCKRLARKFPQFVRDA